MTKEKWKIERFDIEPFEKMPKGLFIGVDPGTVHLGIAVLWETQVTLYQVSIARSANPIERMQDAQKIMTECIHNYSHLATVCIEGASFADKYRQVELAEMRASIAWWGLSKKFRIEILPPNSIRKIVFNNGKLKAHEVWTNIPHDCAAALSCALAVSL